MTSHPGVPLGNADSLANELQCQPGNEEGCQDRGLRMLVRAAFLGRPCTGQDAAKSDQVPGTPLSSWSPRPLNSMPEPAVRSTRVRVARISSGLARAATRLAMCTA